MKSGVSAPAISRAPYSQANSASDPEWDGK